MAITKTERLLIIALVLLIIGLACYDSLWVRAVVQRINPEPAWTVNTCLGALDGNPSPSPCAIQTAKASVPAWWPFGH